MCEQQIEDVKILYEFLNKPLSSGNEIFDKFERIPGHIRRRGNEPLQEFLYIRGARKNKILLVAHVDTYWDNQYIHNGNIIPNLVTEGNIIRSHLIEYGIGADDRAGCAMLWLMRDSGHSLLLTNGEEGGRIGSYWLMNDPGNNNIREEIQSTHQFIIQLDRRNARDFKCYSVGTPEFRNYVEKKTGYTEPDRSSFTDIVTLCRNITGVNLSVGYRNEHSHNEELHLNDWLNTLKIVRRWLSEENLPQFKLE